MKPFASILKVFILIMLGSSLTGCDLFEEPELKDNSDVVDETEGLLVPVELIFSGREVCGMQSLDSIDQTHIQVRFDGSACNDVYKRYGTLDIYLVNGKDWADEGAVISVNYDNFRNERNTPRSENKIASSTIINGTELITNLSGGSLAGFEAGGINFIRRRYVGKDMSVEYNNSGYPRQINTIAERDMINENGEIKIITRGGGEVDGYSNVIEWGVDNLGRTFWNVTEEPIVKTLCNRRWLITDGVKAKNFRNRATRRNIYGVNEEGVEVNNCDSYGYLENWINAGGFEQNVVHGYYD